MILKANQPCKTKIIATIGPSSSDKSTLIRLIKAGATIFRINLSHSSKQRVEEYIQLIRETSEEIDICNYLDVHFIEAERRSSQPIFINKSKKDLKKFQIVIIF